MNAQLNHPLVVGAGLVGSLWSTLLAQRGHEVTLVDRRPDMRAEGFRGGRSINLAMSTRGWKALRMAGLEEEVRKHALPMRGRMMHDRAGHLTVQPYGKADQAIYSVSRGGLNLLLLNAAEATGKVNLVFDHKCNGFDKRSLEVSFTNEKGEKLKTKAPAVFGADGAYSALRSTMLRTPRFNYEQSYLDYGYKELHIPAKADGTHRIDPEALHIWPRGKFMMIALPNPDGSFTSTLFMPYGGENGFDALLEVADAQAFFEREFADSLEHLLEFVEDWTSNPVSPLVTVRCSPWDYQQQILLMGDASHAIVPFYGQGMNSGFEDCSLLAEALDAQGANVDWESLISGFSESRPKDANAIADLALKNFVEMRDRVADPQFLRQKELAALMHQTYGDDFLPVYSQVSFSNTPYSEAWANGEVQEKILSAFAKTNPEGVPSESELRMLADAYHRKV